jgi:hypothetical protein
VLAIAELLTRGSWSPDIKPDPFDAGSLTRLFGRRSYKLALRDLMALIILLFLLIFELLFPESIDGSRYVDFKSIFVVWGITERRFDLGLIIRVIRQRWLSVGEGWLFLQERHSAALGTISR